MLFPEFGNRTIKITNLIYLVNLLFKVILQTRIVIILENYEVGQDEQFSIVSVEKSSFKARKQLIK